jgi:succinoglycan biosynthesis protein ExoA
MTTRVLVVIPTLNEAAHIEACVRALAEEGDAYSAEFVIMDGGSRDGTCEAVRRLGAQDRRVRLAHNPRRIQAAAVNAAIAAAADADVLVRCDAHARYPEGYISRLLAAMTRTGADSVVVPMDAVGVGCFQRAAAWAVDTPLGSGGSPHRAGTRSGFVDHGHHAAFNAARFRELGGYDETFSHNEDAEYDRRLTEAGGRIWLDAEIRIGYFPRETPAGLWWQYWNYGRGRARMLAKHRAVPKLRQVIPVLNLCLLIASAAIAPWAPLAAAIWPALYLALLVGVSLYLAAVKRSVCGLGAGLALVIMHSAWALGFLAVIPAILKGVRA